jgi:hypothetical protein
MFGFGHGNLSDIALNRDNILGPAPVSGFFY